MVSRVHAKAFSNAVTSESMVQYDAVSAVVQYLCSVGSVSSVVAGFMQCSDIIIEYGAVWCSVSSVVAGFMQ